MLKDHSLGFIYLVYFLLFLASTWSSSFIFLSILLYVVYFIEHESKSQFYCNEMYIKWRFIVGVYVGGCFASTRPHSFRPSPFFQMSSLQRVPHCIFMLFYADNNAQCSLSLPLSHPTVWCGIISIQPESPNSQPPLGIINPHNPASHISFQTLWEKFSGQ